MLDELFCMEMREGQKKISISKVLARATYLVAGFGSGIGGKFVYHRFIKKDKKQ